MFEKGKIPCKLENMHWADEIAKKIIDSGKYKPYWVDDMKTPSGYAHIGSMMGPVIHSCIYRALKVNGHDAKLTYIFNDFDPADEFPSILKEVLEGHQGKALKMAPSPDPNFGNLADMLAVDLKKSIEYLGFEAEYLSSWDMYHEGRFNEVIRIALDNSEKIQEIYRKVSGSKKKEAGWLPFQVICEKCGKLGTTKVFAWDGEQVSYKCEPKLVTWATGCGHKGKTSPFDGSGKLPWKVDWAAHWKVLDITVEGAGKDHASAGGSYDIALTILKEVFNKEKPYHFGYEFLLIGGRKMSSSKGVGLKAHDLVKILPSPVARFLFVNNDIFSQGNFNPIGTMAISDLFDAYDKSWVAYNNNGDKKLSRTFELSQIKEVPKKNKELFIPRFRDVVNYIQQPNIDLHKKIEELKGGMLTFDELKILKEREKYGRVWIGDYAPEEFNMEMTEFNSEFISNLSAKQKEFLLKISKLIENETNPDGLQLGLYKISRELNLPSLEAFKAIYNLFLGKDRGPRAAWFLLQYPKKQVLQRFKLVNNVDKLVQNSKIKKFEKPKYFTINKNLKQKYPSVSIGIALIEGVDITKSDSDLEKEKNELFESLEGLTTEKLGEYSEVVSYRKLYKETGIDWHSRRPSPEALLRRVALNKSLYSINTCVDAYNLVVMKNRISVGAFDADNIKFPTTLRFAKEGEEILLLGDEKPTKYKEGEVAYFDKLGGYNMDFNYRDSQRTMVTEKTKNVWINVDGVYDATPEKVQKSLDESVEKILKYCGGKLKFKGVVV